MNNFRFSDESRDHMAVILDAVLPLVDTSGLPAPMQTRIQRFQDHVDDLRAVQQAAKQAETGIDAGTVTDVSQVSWPTVRSPE